MLGTESERLYRLLYGKAQSFLLCFVFWKKGKAIWKSGMRAENQQCSRNV